MVYKLRRLPIGIQNFAELRRKDFLYVDKTREILRMISSGKAFFLSRPRRFGKSLLVSTLDAIFKGEKTLFEGLYIYDKIDWSEQYPVIKLDWSSITHTNVENMEDGTAIYLKRFADFYGVTLEQKYAVNRFEELICDLHQKTGKQVVVLIDEYDMPILDALNKPPETINALRDFLQSFYRILKASDEHIRFIFLTGISKFSKVSIFSGLNNLLDITLSKDYAALCGYTQEELERSFEPYIEAMATEQQYTKNELLQRIRRWYNGYSWDGVTSVYNPFSTLLLFTEKYSAIIGLRQELLLFW
jgi:hypothetical protein